MNKQEKVTNSISVRHAELKDAAGLTAILNPIIAEAKQTVLSDQYTVEQEEDFIRNFPERGIFLVAEDTQSGELLGMQSVEPYEPYTCAFSHVCVIGTYVHDKVRGRGVGSLLSEHMFSQAKKKGYEKIFTYVRKDNPGAINFYLKQGFSAIGIASKQARIGGKYIDEVLIEKFL